MAKNLDPKFTEKIAAWLNSKHEDESNVREGATILLQLNRNRGLYERVMRCPMRHIAKVEYELKKHLNYRLDGYSINDIVKMDEELTPIIKVAADKESEALNENASAEVLPIVTEKSEESEGQTVVKGKRPDHDNLPDNIKELWIINAERWKKIKAAYELLKTLNAPCDRYEHLKVLKESWYKYKEDMCKYDDFKSGEEGSEGDGKKALDENEKQMVNYAQSYISRYLPELKELVAQAKEENFSDDAKARLEDYRIKISNRVNILLKAGVVLSEERKQDLALCDIPTELEKEDAEG